MTADDLRDVEVSVIRADIDHGRHPVELAIRRALKPGLIVLVAGDSVHYGHRLDATPGGMLRLTRIVNPPPVVRFVCEFDCDRRAVAPASFWLKIPARYLAAGEGGD